MGYPGGKGKTYQHLINLMPPHPVYIEAFLGGGAVMNHKAPASRNIGIDLDEQALDCWQPAGEGHYELCRTDAVTYLQSFPFQGSEVVYCDPPYLPETRRRARVYRHDFTRADHERLLDTLLELPCKVLISGYDSALYDQKLRGWQQKHFRSKTHVETVNEVVWFNYTPPDQLHDPRFLGQTAHQRQTVKRRRQRLQDKIQAMPEIERHAFLQWIETTYGPVSQRTHAGNL